MAKLAAEYLSKNNWEEYFNEHGEDGTHLAKHDEIPSNNSQDDGDSNSNSNSNANNTSSSPAVKTISSNNLPAEPIVEEEPTAIIIEGTDDNDVIDISQYENHSELLIEAGDGHDHIIGNDNQNLIDAGAGNDVIDGGGGGDIVIGGAGEDIFVLREGNGDDENGTWISDFSAEDKLRFDDGVTKIWIKPVYNIDGAQTDLIVFADEAGTKMLAVLSGFTTLLSFTNLENGDIDVGLIGLTDNDSLYGGGGDDTNYGGYGEDYIDGGEDNDTIYGGFGDDEIYGGAGNDEIYGDEGENTLYGGEGNDEIYGGLDRDEIYGGADNDYLNGRGGADVIDGGEGIDAVSYFSSDEAVIINMADAIYQGGDAEGDVVTNVENLVGSKYNDVLTGDADNNRIFGETGDDILFGNGGSDSLYGGEGADQFVISTNAPGSTSSYMKIKDFAIGTDKIALDDGVGMGNLSFSQFNDHTVIWQKNTSNVFALIENTALSDLSVDDFVTLEVV